MNDIIHSPLLLNDDNNDSNDDIYNNMTTTTTKETDITPMESYDEDDNNINPIILKVEPKIAIIFLLLGIGNVFPYHSFMVSVDYLDYLFPTFKIASTFPFVYMICICVTFVILIKYQNKIRQHMILLVQLPISMLIMIIIPIVNMDGGGGVGSNGSIGKYIFTLILISCTAIIDGCCQGAIYSFAGQFGPQYTNFVQFGVGVSGVIVLITKLICKLSFGNDKSGLKVGSIVFFSISAFVVLIAWLSFIYCLKLPIGKVILKKKQEHRGKDDQDNDDNDDIINRKELKSTISTSIKYVVKKCWQYLIIIFYTFFLLALLYPSIVIQISPVSISNDWFIFIMISTYNISDCIGKMLPALMHSKWIPSIKIVWSMLIGRTVFIALFFLAIYTTIFKHDAWILCFISLFGFSKGYCATYALSEGPKQFERKFKGLVAILLQSSFNFGLLIGSVFNLIIVNIQ